MGKYNSLRPNANPNSDFGRWFEEEKRRAWDGLTDPKTGMYVTGDLYWLLNYCPIHQVKKNKKGFTIRTMDFPRFWDGQYFMSYYI